MDWDFVGREVYDISLSYSDRDPNLMSSSSSLVKYIMEVSATPSSSFFEEILSLGSICLEDD